MTDFSFVPGFSDALARQPAIRALRDGLAASAASSWLTHRIRALVALTVAQAAGCEYAIWANAVAARDVGLSGEDISLACAGTALDNRERVAVSVARAATVLGISETAYHDPSSQVPLAQPEIQAVLDAVAQDLIDLALIAGLAPRLQRERT